MQETISPSLTPQVQPDGKGGKKKIIIIVIILVLLATAAFFVLRKPQAPQETEVTVTETQEEPTPTEKPEINKESVRIQVLNGTGTPGQAGTAVEALTDAGYSTDNIKAANAEDYDHTATTIDFREGFEDVAVDIQGALGSKFDNVEISSTRLDDDSEYDIVVTTGGKKFEEAATPNPTKSNTTPTPTSSTSVTPTSTHTPTPTP